MRNRSAWILMEQAVGLLAFALAAALCLRAFVWADGRSRQDAALDGALLQAQSAAQQLQHHAGDLEAAAQDWGGQAEGETWVISFDEAWQQVSAGCYRLEASAGEENAWLGRALVRVTDEAGKCLAQLEIFWQKEGPV